MNEFFEKTNRGKFIVFEGIDGSGTTTASKAVTKHIQDVLGSNSVIWTFQPSSLPVGQFIRMALRHEIQDEEGEEWNPSSQTMAHLFTADRFDHLKYVIEPALLLGRHVICDRYLHSTLGYQALTSGMSLEEAYARLIPLCQFCTEPDMVFVFDVDPEEAARRRNRRRSRSELFEVEDLQRKLAMFYRWLPAMGGAGDFKAPGKVFRHIDAGRPPASVVADCLVALRDEGVL
jgi:dTMP kinase